MAKKRKVIAIKKRKNTQKQKTKVVQKVRISLPQYAKSVGSSGGGGGGAGGAGGAGSVVVIRVPDSAAAAPAVAAKAAVEPMTSMPPPAPRPPRPPRPPRRRDDTDDDDNSDGRGGGRMRVDSVPMPLGGVRDPGPAVIAERGNLITARETALMDRLATAVGNAEVVRRHSTHDQMEVDSAHRGRLTMAQPPQEAGDVVMSHTQPPPPPPPPAAPSIVINNNASNASNAGSSDSAASIAMAFRAAQEEYMRTRGVDEQRQVAGAQLVDAMSTALAPVRQLIEQQVDAQNRGAEAEAAQLTRQVDEQRLEARAAARDLHLEDRFGAAMRHIMAEVRQTQQQVQATQQWGQGSLAALTSAVEREASRLNGRIDQVVVPAPGPVEALPEATVLAEVADAVPLDRQAVATQFAIDASQQAADDAAAARRVAAIATPQPAVRPNAIVGAPVDSPRSRLALAVPDGTIDAMDDIDARERGAGDDGGRARRRKVGDGQAIRVDPDTGLTDAELAEKLQQQGYEERKDDGDA